MNQLSPPSYYGALSIVLSLAVYVLFQSLVSTDGLLAPLARGRIAGVARTLSDATLGVFGLHLTVLLILVRTVYDGQLALPGAGMMLLRTLIVIVVTFTIVLLLRQVKLFRTVF